MNFDDHFDKIGILMNFWYRNMNWKWYNYIREDMQVYKFTEFKNIYLDSQVLSSKLSKIGTQSHHVFHLASYLSTWSGLLRKIGNNFNLWSNRQNRLILYNVIGAVTVLLQCQIVRNIKSKFLVNLNPNVSSINWWYWDKSKKFTNLWSGVY